MILYLDTSALVKRYFLEDASGDVIAQWKAAAQIVTSFVAYSETMACIYRKQREGGLADEAIREIVAAFKADWQSFIRVKVNQELDRHIDRLVKEYPLRGFDAIHLASALVIHDRLQDHFVFACFDDRLRRAALTEGLAAFPTPVAEGGRITGVENQMPREDCE